MKNVALLISLLLLTSCATIMNGGKKTLNFYSGESNTVISVTTQDGTFTEKGDASVEVKKGLVTVVAKKTGCKPEIVEVDSHFSGGWYLLGNLVSWIYFGWALDPIFGGMWYYDQKSFDVTPDCSSLQEEEQSLLEELAAERVAAKKAKRKKIEQKEPQPIENKEITSQKSYPTTYVAVLETISGTDLLDRNSKMFLTDVLRDAASRALPAKQGFVVMTRENINVMLPPGKSLEDCEGSCLAETGRNIAADFVAQARIGKFANFLTITVELYETKTNKLISSITARASDEEALLVEIENRSVPLFKMVLENR